MINKNQSPIFVIKPKVIPLIVATSLIFIILSVVIIVFLSIVGSFCISIFLIGILYLLICKYYKNSVYELHKDYLIKKTKLIVTNEVIIQYKNILDISNPPYFGFDPDKMTLFLHQLPKNISRWQILDIIKKLPGFEVTADGQIQVEGKQVSKLLVNGKPFFEGDTKLGSKNIPADAIDKVQVLRNFNEVSQLKGLENNNDDVAINIKLKKGKRQG
mgnify:CR=1 FL=1